MIMIGAVTLVICNSVQNEQGEIVVQEEKKYELVAGESFGDSALQTAASLLRKETIFAKKDCHFIVISHSIFKNAINDYYRHVNDETLEFMMQNPFFGMWSSFAMKSWLSLFKRKEDLKRNAVIYTEKDKAEDVYFIRSGHVICTKTLMIHERQKDNESLILDDENNVIAIARDSTVKPVQIAVLKPGQIFGEEECYTHYKAETTRRPREEIWRKGLLKLVNKAPEHPNRESTMIVGSSTAEIWVIPAKVSLFTID